MSSIAVKDKGLPVSNGETSGRGKFVPPKGGSFGLAEAYFGGRIPVSMVKFGVRLVALVL